MASAIPELDSLRSVLNPPPSPTRVQVSEAAPALTEEVEPPVLLIVAKGRVQVVTLESMGVNVVWDDKDPDQVLEEVERTTHTQRVTNPEDSEDYVDVEVIDEIATKNLRGKKRRWLFTKNED